MAHTERKLKRKAQVEAGAYDGRYRTKVVPSKKQKRKNRKHNKEEADDYPPHRQT